jgi:hypothetical protein
LSRTERDTYQAIVEIINGPLSTEEKQAAIQDLVKKQNLSMVTQTVIGIALIQAAAIPLPDNNNGSSAQTGNILAAVLLIAEIEQDPEILKMIIATKLAWSAIEQTEIILRQLYQEYLQGNIRKVSEAQNSKDLAWKILKRELPPSYSEIEQIIQDLLANGDISSLIALMSNQTARESVIKVILALPDGELKTKLMKLLGLESEPVAA